MRPQRRTLFHELFAFFHRKMQLFQYFCINEKKKKNIRDFFEIGRTENCYIERKIDWVNQSVWHSFLFHIMWNGKCTYEIVRNLDLLTSKWNRNHFQTFDFIRIRLNRMRIYGKPMINTIKVIAMNLNIKLEFYAIEAADMVWHSLLAPDIVFLRDLFSRVQKLLKTEENPS